ncbi:MAG: hydroxymethylbilane synthase [Chloroflexi bacterium]|nr:hydroxymethylbilane synthase [Chloroflexota bacterium]
MPSLRLATRGSKLSLVQSDIAADALRAADPTLDIDYVLVRTEGDVDRTSPLHVIGGRGVFVRAVEQALLDGRADIAMHSLKDVPTAAVEGLTLAAILTRGDPRDVLVASGGRRLAELPAGARVGTGSVRRKLLLHALRPDLDVVEIRGNVDTRLGKVASGEYDAVVIAAAGLDRLGRFEEATQVFEALEFLPSPGQGAIAVQCRVDDAATVERLLAVDDAGTRAAVEAERGFLAELGAGCTLPVGAFAQVDGDLVALRAMLGDDAAEHARFGDAAGPAAEGAELGRGLAQQLLAPLPTDGAP